MFLYSDHSLLKLFHSHLLKATCLSVLKYNLRVFFKGLYTRHFFLSAIKNVFLFAINIIQLNILSDSWAFVSPKMMSTNDRLEKVMCCIDLKLNHSFILSQNMFTISHSKKRWLIVSLCKLQKPHISHSFIPISSLAKGNLRFKKVGQRSRSQGHKSIYLWVCLEKYCHKEDTCENWKSYVQ